MMEIAKVCGYSYEDVEAAMQLYGISVDMSRVLDELHAVHMFTGAPLYRRAEQTPAFIKPHLEAVSLAERDGILWHE